MGRNHWLCMLCLTLGSWLCGSQPLITGPLVSSKVQHVVASRSSSSRYQKPYNVCTSDWAPIVSCAGIEKQSDYDGFQIALWRAIAKDLNWADEDWSFSCVDWTAMIDDLLDTSGSCSFAAAGVEVSLPNIMAGLQFSWPIYKSGFSVLIASHVEEGGVWSFAETFHWSVWVVLGATALISSMLITLVETFTPGNKANRKGLRGWTWYVMGKMVLTQTHVGDPKTWASRILVLGYAFLVLIIVHLFTATTASKMTMQRLANDITGKADLPGKKVESWEPYVPLLRKYSIDADGLAWDNDVDTDIMLDNLRIRKYQALVLDTPVVQYLTAIAPSCDLYPVGEQWETFNIAIAFPPDVPIDLPANVSASIVRLQTSTAILDQLENDYVKSAKTILPDGTTHSCNVYTESSQSDAVDPQITFHQVSGLWYILAISAAVAVIALAVQFAIRYRQKIRGVVSSVTGGKIANPALEQGSKNVAVTGVEEADAVAEVIQPDEKLSTGAKPRRSAALADDERTTVQVLASPKIPGEVVSRQTTFKR